MKRSEAQKAARRNGRKTGRPTSYRPEYVEQCRQMSEAGATAYEIASAFGVTPPTLYYWGVAHPEFLEALKIGKALADERVITSLYHRANGYSHSSEKILVIDGEVVRVPYVEHHPPDVAAAFIWLKNRRPTEWRDRREESHDGNVTVTIKRVKVDGG